MSALLHDRDRPDQGPESRITAGDTGAVRAVPFSVPAVGAALPEIPGRAGHRVGG